jgi:hypothetical protein
MMIAEVKCTVTWWDYEVGRKCESSDTLRLEVVDGDVPARPAGAAAAALVEGMVARAAAERAQSESTGDDNS